VLIEQPQRQLSVVVPGRPAAPLGSERRQLSKGPLQQHREIDGFAPLRGFLGPASRYHLPDDGRQNGRRVLPADRVQVLEGLVDELQGMTAFGENPYLAKPLYSISPLRLRHGASQANGGMKPIARKTD
jgi:hypothetical protein